MTRRTYVDGAGYPRGPRGADIPIGGRIVAVADVYDALTNVRPYEHAWPVSEAIAEIISKAGTQFDPTVVTALRLLLGREGRTPVA